MTEEEIKNQTTQETADSTTVSASDVRSHDLFLKLTQQLRERDEQLQKLSDAQKQADDERERKRLESQGEYETLTKQLKAEMKTQQEKHAQELRNLKLEAALSRAGVTNETFIKGAMMTYNPDGQTIEEYVETLKAREENAYVFGEPAGPVGQAPPGTARPGSRAISKTNWAQVREDLKDPKTAVAADEKLREWFKNNEGYPPGWS